MFVIMASSGPRKVNMEPAAASIDASSVKSQPIGVDEVPAALHAA